MEIMMKFVTTFFLLCSTLAAFADTSDSSNKSLSSKVNTSRLTPTAALQKLIDGNERYTKDLLLHADSSAERREAISSKQEPFAVILGCSDSRVPPEIIFDQGVGDLFIVRVAGNVAGPIELDSMEYAVKHLHSSIIMVLGHENCGAVQVVVDGGLSGIDHVAALIKPAVAKCKNLDQCVQDNVNYVVKMIKDSALIGPHVANGEINVVGA